jgi:hypothetical protein
MIARNTTDVTLLLDRQFVEPACYSNGGYEPKSGIGRHHHAIEVFISETIAQGAS